jgi:hypothetical protein
VVKRGLGGKSGRHLIITGRGEWGLPAVGSCAVSAGGVKPVRSTPAGTALGWGEG